MHIIIQQSLFLTQGKCHGVPRLMSHFTVKAFPTVQTHVFIISRVFTHHSCDTLTLSQVLYRSGATTHLIHAEKNKAIANSIIAFA